jgi:glyoxylase I family protein
MKVHHIAVMVTDLARAEQFYATTVGLRVFQRWNDDTGTPRSFWCDLGSGVFLAVEKARDSVPAKTDTATGWHMVALAIKDAERDALKQRLTEAGYPVVRETGFTFYVRDPDGNLVGFSHYPDKRA